MRTSTQNSKRSMLFYNNTGLTIPAFGVFKASGPCVNVNNNVAISASIPNGLNGCSTYFINGATKVPPGRVGECDYPANRWLFALFNGDPNILIPWKSEVGPVLGSFHLGLGGDSDWSGAKLLYAGAHDTQTSKIAVFIGIPDNCQESSDSSGSQSTTSASGSGDGSADGSGGGCIEVVTKVRCVNGSLEVTYGKAVGC